MRPRRPQTMYEGSIKPASPKTAAEVKAFRDNEKHRTRCSVCKQPFDWFQLDGSDRCNDCQP